MTKIKKSDLKNHLLQSINILKRSLDYATYCYFILAMLFFYHVGEMPSLYTTRPNLPRIMASSSAPARISLQTSSRRRRNLYGDLSDSFSEIEGSIPILRNVLLPAIQAKPIDESALSDYQDLLGQLQQRTGIFSSPQNFSHAYDYWISQLAKLTTKQGVSFYTPRSVIRMMVGMVKPAVGMSIYDPTVGTGGMFTGSAHYISHQGGDIGSVEFYGCEVAADIWAICKMNMLAHGLEQAVISQNDVLQNPPDFLGRIDLVLQNLPLLPGSKGQVQRHNNDLLRHVLEVLSLNGRAAILTPSSLLQEDHRDLWRQVVGRDWLEAVISLPAKLLHGTNASANILIFNKNKVDTRSGKVLFVQASNEPLPYARHNELEDHTVESVIQAYDAWQSIPDFARVVPNQRIEEYDYKLSVDKYLRLEEDVPTFDVLSALRRYQSAVQEREAAVDKLMRNLETLNNSVQPCEDNKPTT